MDLSPVPALDYFELFLTGADSGKRVVEKTQRRLSVECPGCGRRAVLEVTPLARVDRFNQFADGGTVHVVTAPEPEFDILDRVATAAWQWLNED